LWKEIKNDEGKFGDILHKSYISACRKVNWKRSIKIILAETTERVKAEL